MAELPYYLASEVGHVLQRLTNPRGTAMSGAEIVEELLARGRVADRAEARRVLAQARANVTATARIQRASTGQSLRSACDYKCPDSTMIALRILYTPVDAHGRPLGTKSVVVQGRADMNLRDVLNRAYALAMRTLARSDKYRGLVPTIDRPFDVSDIQQVLLDYTQGRP